MIHIVITYHYPTDDIKCSGDFYEATLMIDGEKVWSLDDYYHDKPQERFDGFLKALKWAKIEYKLETKHINDIDY